MPPTFTLARVRQMREANPVLDDISFELAEGTITAIVGPSGSGKTSLLRLFNRLDDPVDGEIRFRSRPLLDYPVHALRRKVGFVFQTPVMFVGTVRANLQVAATLGVPREPVPPTVEDAMALAGLDPSLADRAGARLSVGQKQRANIARALMTSPEVLLMDEPTSALDPETADRLVETVRSLSRNRGLTVVMVTHRLSEARRASDATLVLIEGRVAAFGATRDVFDKSDTSRVRDFLESER